MTDEFLNMSLKISRRQSWRRCINSTREILTYNQLSIGTMNHSTQASKILKDCVRHLIETISQATCLYRRENFLEPQHDNQIWKLSLDRFFLLRRNILRRVKNKEQRCSNSPYQRLQLWYPSICWITSENRSHRIKNSLILNQAGW